MLFRYKQGMEKRATSYTATLHDRIGDITPAEWDACAGADNPFVSHAFLSALEDSGAVGGDTGWVPQPMILRDSATQIVAVVPLYVKLHSYGEYVFDQGWAEALERAGGHYYPKLQVSVPFSPVPGPRLLRCAGADVSAAVLGDALIQACRQFDMSSAHITFCEREEAEALGQAGWMQRLGMQYHWHNRDYAHFDDFLAALTANHRKSIRRERRDANNGGLTFLILRGADIKAYHWDAFFRFYRMTVDRKWGEAYLTRDFFALLSERLDDKVVLMMAQRDGVPVAGALNLMGADTLYGRNWGSVGHFPFLHFELCYYRAIDFAIEHKLKRVEAGAQGEHKIQRGYVPQPTYSAHFIAHAGLARAVENFLTEERNIREAQMHELAAYAPFRQVV